MRHDHKGNNNPMYGKSHSEESKEKMRVAKLGNRYRLGTTQTEDVKKNISRTQRARGVFGKGYKL